MIVLYAAAAVAALVFIALVLVSTLESLLRLIRRETHHDELDEGRRQSEIDLQAWRQSNRIRVERKP